MSIREAIEALRIEGEIEITGNLRRVAEFFKGLDTAVSVLEEMQRCKERQVAIRVAERERKGKSGASGLEIILCEMKEAMLEAYLDVANNYSVSDLHSDRDKVSVVAARTRSKIDERIEAIIMAHMDDTDWKAEAQKQCSAAGELRKKYRPGQHITVMQIREDGEERQRYPKRKEYIIVALYPFNADCVDLYGHHESFGYVQLEQSVV